MSIGGRFITLEGGEGAGKTTQIQNLRQWFESRGSQVLITRQPGGTVLAEKIRDLLLHEHSEPVAPLTELLLLFAARAQFLSEVVKPALSRGETVLCDRFTDSTYAYQGGGRGMSLDHIASLESLVQGDLQPELTLLLDLPVTVGMERAAGRSIADRIENEDMAFFERVRSAYRSRAEALPERFVLIDGSQPPEEVWLDIQSTLEKRYPHEQ